MGTTSGENGVGFGQVLGGFWEASIMKTYGSREGVRKLEVRDFRN